MMEFKKWDGEMSFSLKKIPSLKKLEGLGKCRKVYKINQSNDFDEA